MRILIIEDHQVVADGLAVGFATEGHTTETHDGDPGTLGSVLDVFEPEVVLLDLHLGEGSSGIHLLPILKRSTSKVVVLTSETRAEILAVALRAGAETVLEKTIPFPDLIDEITRVHEAEEGDAPVRREEILRAARAVEADRDRRLAPFRLLTPREEEVLSYLIQGRHAAEIAEASFVSLTTVRSQIQAVLTKLGVNSQLAAVTMAIKAGWQPPVADQ